MTTITIDDPELVETVTVGTGGRVTIGRDLEGRRVRIAVELVEEDE